MDRILSLKKFRNFNWSLNSKYKHFNEMYRQKLLDFHHDELLDKSYRQYLDGHPNPDSDLAKKAKAMVRSFRNKTKFIQDELTMYKCEMAMWRDISLKVDNAYNYLYDRIIRQGIKKSEEYRKYLDILADNLKIHVYITGYGRIKIKHHVTVYVMAETLPDELKDSPIAEIVGAMSKRF